MIHYANFREFNIQNIQIVRKRPDTSRSFVLILSPEECIQVECSSILECEEWLSELISLKTDEHLEKITGRKDARRVSYPLTSSKSLREMGESQIRLCEFVYENEQDIHTATNGTFCSNTYSVPLAAAMNAEDTGFIPYDSLVKLDENSCKNGSTDGSRDDNTTTTRDSYERDCNQAPTTLSNDSTPVSSAVNDMSHVTDEDTPEIDRGMRTVNISSSLLAEALASLGGPKAGNETPCTDTSDTTSTKPNEASLSVNSKHQHKPPAPIAPDKPPAPPRATPPLIQPTTAQIRPSSATISPSFEHSDFNKPRVHSQQHSSRLSLDSIQQIQLRHSCPSARPNKFPLPSGWEQKQAPDGRLYYVHHATKSTQWERPI